MSMLTNLWEFRPFGKEFSAEVNGGPEMSLISPIFHERNKTLAKTER